MTELADKGADVVEDQSTPGHVLTFSEDDASTRYPGLTIASPVALRKGNTSGVVTA